MKKSGSIHITAALFFLIFCSIATYPLVFKLKSYIPGFFSTDESYAIIWNGWFTKYSLVHQLSLKSTDYISYPFGVEFLNKNIPVSYIWVIINIILPVLTTPIIAYNLQVIMNMLFAACFTYLLAYYLTKNRYAAFLSGIIFGFCPFMFVRSWQHLGETFVWTMPLFIWSLFRLKDSNSLTVKVFFVISLVLAAINYAVIYYTFVITAIFLIYLLCKFKEDKSYLGKIFVLSGSAFIILIFQFWPVFKNLLFPSGHAPSAHNIFLRPFNDLFEQSARPLSFFLPSATHPLFGKFTEQFIGTPLYGMSLTEHTLYLGWVPLTLAFIAFRIWRRSRKSPGRQGFTRGSPENNREDFYIGFFVFLAFAAWLFSQPPWWDIFGFKLYMPSFFMYKILPMFRAYCRFGIVVMLAVAVLAGYGLKFILERFKSRKTKVAITALFCGLVLFEFWNWPPYKVIDISKVPAVYYWIKEQPKDIVIADYPLDADSPNELYKFFQTAHEKKIINGTIPGTHANKVAQEIRRLSQPKTASILKWMGVKYVVVHKDDYLKTDLIEDKEDMERIPQNQGLKFVKSFPPQECPEPELMCVQKTGAIDVYEVIASPIKPEIGQ